MSNIGINYNNVYDGKWTLTSVNNNENWANICCLKDDSSYDHHVIDIYEGQIVSRYGKERWQYRRIVSDIKDVEVINDNEGKPIKVVVTFTDNEKETAITKGSDIFNLEMGISICITKRLLSEIDVGEGHSLYNKIIKRGVKVYNQKIEKEHKEAEEKARIEAKKEKCARKRAERKARKEAEARSKRIEEQAEAYYQAMMRTQNKGRTDE